MHVEIMFNNYLIKYSSNNDTKLCVNLDVLVSQVLPVCGQASFPVSTTFYHFWSQSHNVTNLVTL